MPIQGLQDARSLLETWLQLTDTTDPKTRTRTRILQAATSLFAKHGYRRVPVDDVAREAHVAKGTIYLYYRKKVDLMVAAIAYEKLQYIDRINPILALPERDQLHAYLVLALTMAADMPLLGRLMSGDREIMAVLSDMNPEDAEQMAAQGVELLGPLIRDAVAPGQFSKDELAAHVQMIRSSIVRGVDTPGLGSQSPRQMAELFATTMVAGLREVAK